MLAFVLRRLLLTVPTLLGVTLLCFTLMHLAGGNPAENMGAGRFASPAAIAHTRAYFGLDQPWYLQFGHLLWRFLSFDLGTSWQDGRPIAQVMAEALPVTLMLASGSLLLSYLIAVPLGVYSAVRRDSPLDRLLTFSLFLLYSLPTFWVGSMALVFLASGRYVRCDFLSAASCFPIQGWHRMDGFEQLSWGQQVGDVLWHLVLPLSTLTYSGLAVLSRYTRTAMLETLQQDYVRTARAKGLSERAVVMGHAMRNSLLPIVTLFGLSLPELVTGSVIVESVFGIRGMGLVTLEAIRLPDYPLVIINVAAVAMLTAFGVLIADVLCALIDPRLRSGPMTRQRGRKAP